MSKLSGPLKALISTPHARPGYTSASAKVRPALSEFVQDATSKNVGLPAWVTISTAVSATMNCPEAMAHIFELATELSASSSSSSSPSSTQSHQHAELIREVGLKCISFNGIPRSINCLGAFYGSLPASVKEALASRQPSRQYTVSNLADRQRVGLQLWNSVYTGFEQKLLNKLAQSHPDLPVHILNGHYSNLLSDPPQSDSQNGAAKVGRVGTSLVAIACLRAQTGVGPQVTSHVFGLRKAYENGDARAQGESEVVGGEWLASDEGSIWMLESVDKLVSAIGGGLGSSFAPGMRAKL